MQKKILEKINDILKDKKTVVIAIDGRCGAGKTTLADFLKKQLHCNVFHMDDFFLRPEQRTIERLNLPGENIDHERFLSEVLVPISKGENFFYRPFDCKTRALKELVEVTHNSINVVEGSYSCHAKLWDYYDLHVFVDIDYDEQLKRIEKRNGKDGLELFKTKWIPLEEKYFATFKIKENCEIII